MSWLHLSPGTSNDGLHLYISGLDAASEHDVYLYVSEYGPALARVARNAAPPADQALSGYLFNKTAFRAFGSAGEPLTLAMLRGLYVGSFVISDEAGVCKCHVSYGQSREWGVWNAYNQQAILLRAGDLPHYHQGRPLNNPTWEPFAADPRNSMKVFTGRPCPVSLEYWQSCWRHAQAGHNAIAHIGIGWNSDLVPSGSFGWFVSECLGAEFAIGGSQAARLHVPDANGANVATMLIRVPDVGTSHADSIMYFGNTESDHSLVASYLG